MNIQQAIKKVIANKDLSISEMQTVMLEIMHNKTTDAQIGALLACLAAKGESIDEIIGAAKVMRSLCTRVEIKNNKHLIDTCGTGGDGKGVFNISTAAAFVAAVGGALVAKHGNRSISSKSGSADLLECAGANLSMSTANIARSIINIGVGFMFAQNHHSAMRHVIRPRKELGCRTIFNMLGPLTNPAAAPNQLIGVYDKKLTTIFAQVLQKLGANRALIVHSQDGMDEISSFAPTYVSELKNNTINNYVISPQDFGIKSTNLNSIIVNNSEQSLLLIKEALGGKKTAAADIIALNAGAALYVSSRAKDLASGVAQAQDILHSKKAYKKLNDFVNVSQELS